MPVFEAETAICRALGLWDGRVGLAGLWSVFPVQKPSISSGGVYCGAELEDTAGVEPNQFQPEQKGNVLRAGAIQCAFNGLPIPKGDKAVKDRE